MSATTTDADADTEPGGLDILGQPTHAAILGEIRGMRRESRQWRREVFEPTIKAIRDDLAANTLKTEQALAVTESIAARRTWWRGLKERLGRVRWWLVGIATTVASVLAAWWEIAKLLGRGGGVGPWP